MSDAHTMKDLEYYQALPLSLKIPMSRNRIRKWVDKYGVDGSCVVMTFSPESLVLLHLVHKYYPSVRAVFGGSEDLKPMTAWMASEDEAGLQDWLSYGCNHFDADRPEGHPISFWTKEDVLEYIRKETADIEI